MPSQALVQLEQERHANAAKDVQLALLRQRLRCAATSGSGVRPDDATLIGAPCLPPSLDYASLRQSGGGSKKRPLPVSGWEELIEEAAADLEQVLQDECILSYL